MEAEEIIRLGVECLNAFEYFRITEICKRLMKECEDREIYQFYIEDKNKPLVKYMALGEI